jgi:hypothetical protein
MVPPRALNLLAHKGRHDWQRDQLRMRVLQRRAGRPAMILEQQDVAQAVVLPEVAHALAEGREHSLDFAFGHRRQRLVMIGCLDDDLVRADPVHAVEHPLAFTVEPTLHLQRGELVGNDAQFPSGAIPDAIRSIREHLRRRQVLSTRAKRAVPVALNLVPLQPKVARTLAALRRDDHPAAGDRVFTKLRHC